LFFFESQAWWRTPVIPAPRRLRQENQEFHASLGYFARACLKKPKPSNQTKNPKAFVWTLWSEARLEF
jgi:hypothetical protein